MWSSSRFGTVPTAFFAIGFNDARSLHFPANSWAASQYLSRARPATVRCASQPPLVPGSPCSVGLEIEKNDFEPTRRR